MHERDLTRRGALGATAAGLAWLGAPAFLRAAGTRPGLPFGLQTGDVGLDGAIVWAKSDRPARLRVEWDTSEAFRSPRRVDGPELLPASDLTGVLALSGLPAGQTICVRAWAEDATGAGVPAFARFRTPVPGGGPGASTRIAWSGDTCGQGWGINPEWGGLRGYAAVRALNPDVFVHSGDVIYADNPLEPEVRLPDGRIWRNLVTPAKRKVAETLDEFRGNFAYNLLDAHLRACAAEVPFVTQWDDHEVLNNWWPGQRLTDPRYTERDVDVLAARARQAFFEYTPTRRPRGPVITRTLARGLVDLFVVDLRSHRAPNGPNRQAKAGPGTAMLGEAQRAALLEALSRSTATWRIIACDMPIGLQVQEAGAPGGPPHQEGFANGPGAPLGRELELAALFDGLAERRIGGVVFITADVHYAAAHRYHPPRGAPLHEFVAGPLHAGTFGPNPLDPTFSPTLLFQKAPPPGQFNLPPWDGLQFIGVLDVDGATRTLTARLQDIEGRELYRLELPPPG